MGVIHGREQRRPPPLRRYLDLSLLLPRDANDSNRQERWAANFPLKLIKKKKKSTLSVKILDFAISMTQKSKFNANHNFAFSLFVLFSF